MLLEALKTFAKDHCCPSFHWSCQWIEVTSGTPSEQEFFSEYHHFSLLHKYDPTGDGSGRD
jgi:hypothetical protein